MRPARAVVAAWVLAALAVFATPGVSGAQSTTLAAAKALCDSAVSKRVTALTALKADVDAASHVTAQNKATLDANISGTISGLQGLQGTVDADTTLLKLRADCRKIVTQYYVYLFLVPQSRLVVAADRVKAAADGLTSLATLLQARVNAAQKNGKNVSSAQGDVDEIAAKVSAAEQAAEGAQAAVLPLVATGYPGNRSALVSARASMQSAYGALVGALAAAQNAIAALAALH